MKKQNVIAEGFQGVTINLNIFDVKDICEIVTGYAKFLRSKNEEHEWYNQLRLLEGEDREAFKKTNPKPRIEDFDELKNLHMAMIFLEKIVKDIPECMSESQIFEEDNSFEASKIIPRR